MRKGIILFILIYMLVIPVNAMDITAPRAPEEAEDFMPAETETFGEGLWEVIKNGISHTMPELHEAFGVGLTLIVITLLLSVVGTMSERYKTVPEFAAALSVTLVLLSGTKSMINLGVETVTALSDYGKLLLPVMTAALAAQGGGVTSAALYTGSAIFNSLLSSAAVKIMIPMIYIFLTLSIANCAVQEQIFSKLRDFVKWLMSWSMKIALYLFTGYISITGIVSGTADASALKVTKLAISGMVPVVGGILSEASESVLVGAGVLKSAAGVYGLLAFIAIWISPFLKIGAQYIILKATAAMCAGFGPKRISELIQSFSAAMGILLAITGTVCIMLMISTVCFMKGVG